MSSTNEEEVRQTLSMRMDDSSQDVLLVENTAQAQMEAAKEAPSQVQIEAPPQAVAVAAWNQTLREAGAQLEEFVGELLFFEGFTSVDSLSYFYEENDANKSKKDIRNEMEERTVDLLSHYRLNSGLYTYAKEYFARDASNKCPNEVRLATGSLIALHIVASKLARGEPLKKEAPTLAPTPSTSRGTKRRNQGLAQEQELQPKMAALPLLYSQVIVFREKIAGKRRGIKNKNFIIRPSINEKDYVLATVTLVTSISYKCIICGKEIQVATTVNRAGAHLGLNMGNYKSHLKKIHDDMEFEGNSFVPIGFDLGEDDLEADDFTAEIDENDPTEDESFNENANINANKQDITADPDNTQ